MDRTPDFLRRHAPLVALALMLLPAAGCVNALTTVAYLIKGTNVEAQFNDLRNKTVAVVVRPPITMSFQQDIAARELGEEISFLLSQNVSGVEVIDQQEVNDWMDVHGTDFDDFIEVGEELDVESVVAIELEGLRLHSSASVYQGRANVKIRVYDMTDNGKVVFRREPPQSVYPPTGGVPIDQTPAPDFRRRYVRVLAEEIARHFYAHDSHATFARQ